MKTFKLAILGIALCVDGLAATVFRVDPIPVMTVAKTAPAGGSAALYAVGNARITLCADSACASPATAYLDSAGVTTCPTFSPVTVPGVTPPQCSQYAGGQGQFGFWLPTGLYYYKVTIASGAVYGPYALSVGGSGAVTSQTLPIYATSDYDYTPQLPSGTLIIGANVITLGPGPQGVSASAAGGAVYIIGGTSETAPIIGGTCTGAGQLACTVIVSCAHTHAAGFSIQSPSAGIGEAHNFAPIGSTLILPPSSTVYGAATITKAIRVTGGTMSDYSGTLISPQTAGQTVFKVSAAGATLENLSIRFASPQVAGKTIELTGSTETNIHYVEFLNGWDEVYMTDSQSDFIDHCRFGQFQHDAIRVYSATLDATGPHITNNVFYSPQTARAAIAHISTGGLIIEGNGFHNNSTYGYVNLASGSSQVLINVNSFDGQTFSSIDVEPTGDFPGFTISGNFISNFLSPSFAGIYIGNTNARGGLITGNFIAPWYTTSPPAGVAGMVLNGTDWIAAINTISHANAGIQSNAGVDVAVGLHTLVDVAVPWFGGGTNIRLDNPYPLTYAQMSASSVANGSLIYCSDCLFSCAAGSGTGQSCRRVNGAWAGTMPVAYITAESGGNNAIAGTFGNVALASGLTVTVKLSHSLQAGANTFDFNSGGALAIKSSRNVANDIGTAYASTGIITMIYDGTRWLDVSQ